MYHKQLDFALGITNADYTSTPLPICRILLAVNQNALTIVADEGVTTFLTIGEGGGKVYVTEGTSGTISGVFPTNAPSILSVSGQPVTAITFTAGPGVYPATVNMSAPSPFPFPPFFPSFHLHISCLAMGACSRQTVVSCLLSAWLIAILPFAGRCQVLGKVTMTAIKLFTTPFRSAQSWKCSKLLHTADLGGPQATSAQCFFGVNFVPNALSGAPTTPVTTGRKMLQAGH